jgi:hypothetical protein
MTSHKLFKHVGFKSSPKKAAEVFKDDNIGRKPMFGKLKPLSNKKGQMDLMVGLLLGFMVITIMITLIPGFVELIDQAQNSEGLNCKGYTDVSNPVLSYNATIGTKSSIGCLAMKLYLPYIVLAVLIGVVVKMLYGKNSQQQSPYG